MARTRVVTRTINVTTIEALCMDIKTCEPVVKDLELTGETYDNDKALKLARKLYDTETLKVVAIQSITTHEELYGMLETDFLKYATRMDDKRKFVEEEDEQPLTQYTHSRVLE